MIQLLKLASVKSPRPSQLSISESGAIRITPAGTKTAKLSAKGYVRVAWEEGAIFIAKSDEKDPNSYRLSGTQTMFFNSSLVSDKLGSGIYKFSGEKRVKEQGLWWYKFVKEGSEPNEKPARRRGRPKKQANSTKK